MNLLHGDGHKDEASQPNRDFTPITASSGLIKDVLILGSATSAAILKCPKPKGAMRKMHRSSNTYIPSELCQKAVVGNSPPGKDESNTQSNQGFRPCN